MTTIALADLIVSVFLLAERLRLQSRGEHLLACGEIDVAYAFLNASRHPPHAHSWCCGWLAARVVFGDDDVGECGVFALHGSGAHRFIVTCDSLSARQTRKESIQEIAIGRVVVFYYVASQVDRPWHGLQLRGVDLWGHGPESMVFPYTSYCGRLTVSEQGRFHAREQQKGPVRAIVEGDLFLSTRSSFFFLVLSSFFFLLLTQNRALKIKIFVGKSCFREALEGARWGEEKLKM